MDKILGTRCKVKDSSEILPCGTTFKLRPEDEISVDSIISAMLPHVEPSAIQFQNLKWDLHAKDFLNERQPMLFVDILHISMVSDVCKLNADTEIFEESDMQEIGEFKFRVEEGYDGYVVYGKSIMTKEKAQSPSGHCIRGKYDDRLNLICEKRVEHDYVDNAKIERILDARSVQDKIIVRRETKINNGSQHFKAVINVKGRDGIFLLDGGILLLLRYLVLNNFRGDFIYYTMNLFGKVLRCVLTVHKERKHIKMFHRSFANAIHIVNVQYFDDYPHEVSESLYTANGKIIMHYWHGFPYVLHETKGFIRPKEPILPKLEHEWRSQKQLFDRYLTKKKLNYEIAMAYFVEHPELSGFIMDFILNVIKHKPPKLLPFTVKFFQSFRKPPPPS